MLGVLFLAATSFGFATALRFTDCATDKSNTLLTVRHLDISPALVVLPGQIQVSTYITINQQITHLFIDTVLEKQTLGVWTKIPCIGSTHIGSCQNIDFETLLDNMRNGSFGFFHDLGQQLHAILLKALGNKGHCPICPRDVLICHETLTLPPIPSTLNLISQGTYRMRFSVKDDPTTSDNLGCIQFQLEVARKVNPNAVG